MPAVPTYQQGRERLQIKEVGMQILANASQGIRLLQLTDLMRVSAVFSHKGWLFTSSVLHKRII